MSEQIKHECGLAFIRLRKPLEYYLDKYGTALYGLNKLRLLMQKQRNRGQDGAGAAIIKLDMPPGSRYISRKRDNSPTYLRNLFQNIYGNFNDVDPAKMQDIPWLKKNKPYIGELLLGHLRYGTHSSNSIETCHPFLRQNNYITRNLVLAGNFNMTNVDELFSELIEVGQHPKEKSDTVTVLEKIGHFLDAEVERTFNWFKPEGYNNQEITRLIGDSLDVQRVLQRSCRKFDGGYVMAGMLGHGDAFVCRDPAGIRPAFYYADDEVVVMASEKPAIQTAFNVQYNKIQELERGHALIVKKDGNYDVKPFKDQLERKACSFERIYFSRGTDKDIYLERKQLGKAMAAKIMQKVNYDFENTVFSFIPNTAEVAFYGMMEGIHELLNEYKGKSIIDLGANPDPEEVKKITAWQPRMEKLAVKDAKMRTFIADDTSRGEMMSHVYDVTYGIVKNHIDTLVVIDDSIVRGTTLRDSIIQNLARLKPKKIIVLSSAPQIRYPDCYGIDMSKMKNFVAFKALVALLKEDGKEDLLEKTYHACKEQLSLPLDKIENKVKDLYDHYTAEQISAKISEIVTAKNIIPEVEVIYQTIEDLHAACPNHTGDWYFSGVYPTPGGNKIANIAFINFMEKKDLRAYA